MEIKTEIGIVDTRNLITAIEELYGYSFKDYALTSFKRQVEKVITHYSLRDTDALIRKLKEEKGFFDTFLSEITIETTEMFRDPHFWELLANTVIPDLVKRFPKVKIWVGGCESGEELYSLMILLKENNLTDYVQVQYTSISEKNIEKVKQGVFNAKKLEISEGNYEKISGTPNLSQYIVTDENNNQYWDTTLIKNVIFTKINLNFDEIPKNINLVIYRNQMIYFNQPYQDKVLKTIYDAICIGCYLCIGAKETLEYCIFGKKFKIIDEKEKIYKKNI